MLVLTTHASIIKGNIYEAPCNTLVEILIHKKKNFIFIRNFMDGETHSQVFLYKKGIIVKTIYLPTILSISVFRYLSEIILTYLYLLTQPNITAYVGVDPLNAFTGILLKITKNLKTVVFYTADYTETRFTNTFLNTAYHALDRFCVCFADQVWNVSSRIREKRIKMGMVDSHNLFVPNIPSNMYKKFLDNKKNIYKLVMLGVIGDQLDFTNIINAVSELHKKFPKLQLSLVGNGPKFEFYQEYIKEQKLEKIIKLLGHKSHEEALEEISKSGIGLALYNSKWSFNHYGDSMKCREYFCYGLPVITTDTHSTVEEIKKYTAGIVVPMSREAYKKAIIDTLTNYKQFEKNSYLLGTKYANVHEKLIQQLEG